MSVANSIIMTVFNRPHRVLHNTLYALSRNDLTNCEVIIVDDGSTLDYECERQFCAQHEIPAKWFRIEPGEYPGHTYSLDHPDGGYQNNPAMAMNRAIGWSQGHRLMFLSSDCMVPKFAIKEAKQCGNHYWLASVVDQESNLMYICHQRPLPLHFFSSCKRSHVEAIGGFDEEYLRGLAYEDNDFGARVSLQAKHVVFDADVLVIHQSHPPLTYERGGEGIRINEKYTHKKWGGVPMEANNEKDPVITTSYTEKNLLRVTPRLR